MPFPSIVGTPAESATSTAGTSHVVNEITNVEMALKAKELAQATMEKYPVLPQTTDMGVDV